MWSTKIVKLDLRICKTIDDCKVLREDNNIHHDLISDEKLWGYKGIIDVFYYDAETFNIIAVVPHGDNRLQFTDEFVSYMTKIEPLKFIKRKLDLDEILDKINLMGVGSLNNSEKRFLRKF